MSVRFSWVRVCALSALVVLLSTGCSLINATHNAHTLQKLFLQANSMCARAEPGAHTVGALIPAGQAVHELEGAGMRTEPWSTVPPNRLVVECIAPFGGSSILLDLCGRRTSAPPLPATNPCTVGQQCGSLSGYRISPPFQLAGC